MSLNIHISSTPPHLKITQTMIEDFIIDPVLGAKVIMGENLDAFQRVRLKLCWWTPRAMDSSGLSSAKTKNMWIVSNLRTLLMPGHVAGVYYPSFETGKRTYALYFTQVASRAPIYRANMGRPRVLGVDGKTIGDDKAMNKGPSCWVVTFKNDGQILMPAPGFLQDAKTSAGYRFNDLYIDEWTKIESMGSEGIDQQLVGRTTRESWNKNHPIFRNHHLFLATAEDTMHPAYIRYASYLRQVRSGDPDYVVFSFNFKDYSDLPFSSDSTFKDKFREDLAMKDMKNNKTKSGFLQEGLGIWSKNGKGWYTGEMLERCVNLGVQQRTDVYTSRQDDPKGDNAYYFLGVDPARAEAKVNDDGALVCLRAVPLGPTLVDDIRTFDLSFCWAARLRNVDAAFWSGFIHKKHREFGFHGVMLDGGGGGLWIQPELKKSEQVINGNKVTVRPMGTIEDEEGMMVSADFILSMFRPKDGRINKTWEHMPMLRQENITDVAHQEFREGLTAGIAFPMPWHKREKSSMDTWSKEKKWALTLLTDIKTGLPAQLRGIFVVTNDDGTTLYTKVSNARKFESRGKKDFAYAAMMAYMRFLIWMRSGLSELNTIPDEDRDMCWSG